MAISFIRTIILYTLIIVSVRVMGKRQISELQTSELVIMLLISDIASIPMQDTAQSLASGVIPVLTLVAIEVLLSILMLKNSCFRRIVCGRPIIIIDDGKIDQYQLKRLRMSTEDLFEQLRQVDIFNVDDVAYAIVETNGKISIMKKSEQQEVTAVMCNIHPQKVILDVVVVSDGEFSKSSMRYCKVSEKWILEVLSKEGKSLDDVFIMTANKQKKYKIIEKEKIR